MKEEFSVIEHKEKVLQSELDSTKTNYAKSSAFVQQQEVEFKAKISEVESTNDAVKTELEETKSNLAESEAKVEKLANQHATFIARNNELEEKNTNLTSRAQAGEVAKAELDLMKEEKVSMESVHAELKARVEALEKAKLSEQARFEVLEKENASLREEAATKPPPSSSSESDVPSPWKPSPIKPAAGEPASLQDTTFGADDTFDEDMFLPNVDEQPNEDATLTNINEQPNEDEADNTPKSEDSEQTPSKTPFKEKRAFLEAASSAKKTPAKRMSRSRRSKAAGSSTKAKTPAKRMTRASRRLSSRTPLGDVNGESTPSSSRKVRTNFSAKKANF